MSDVIAVFCLGIATGVSCSWHLTRAIERYRRARVDLRTNLDGIRGSWERARAEGVRLAKYAGIALLAAGAVIVGIIAKGHGA